MLAEMVRIESASGGFCVGWGGSLIIRRNAGDSCGLFSIYTSVLSWLIFADEHGMTPIVDLKTYLSPYLEWWEVGRKNAWDFYFEQPVANYSLRDFERSKDVQIVYGDSAPDIPSFYDILDDQRSIERWRLVANRYAPLRLEVLERYQNPDFEAALSSGIVGVLARGTDHVNLRLKGHFIQPSFDQLIARADSFLARLPIKTKVYLVTEDVNILGEFKKYYGDRLIISRQHISPYTGGAIAKHVAMTGKRREHGAAYLKAVYDLARCQYFIGGRNNGMKAAMIMSHGFKESYVFNLGTYDCPISTT